MSTLGDKRREVARSLTFFLSKASTRAHHFPLGVFLFTSTLCMYLSYALTYKSLVRP
jgi:hypothetical protein